MSPSGAGTLALGVGCCRGMTVRFIRIVARNGSRRPVSCTFPAVRSAKAQVRAANGTVGAVTGCGETGATVWRAARYGDTVPPMPHVTPPRDSRAAASPGTHRPAAAAGWTDADDAAFRWLVRRHDAIVRDRAEVGEQIRTIVEGRDPGWGAAAAVAQPAERILLDIRRGRRDAPAPLAAHYRGLWQTEVGFRDVIAERMTTHPVWPWLSRIDGVGTLQAAQLVARLNRSRARRPSSFWAYCGLATIAAVRVECRDCGATLEVAAGARPPRFHPDAHDPDRRCHGVLAPSRGDAEAGDLRIASSRAPSDAGGRYDPVARDVCHQIGVSILRTHGTHERVYLDARERFERERSGWSSGRIHLSALRVMEKRFLLDLWHAWHADPSSERASA